VIEPFLFLESVVDVGGNQRVREVVLVVAIAICTIDAFSLALWSRFHLGNKFFEELDRRHDEGRFAVAIGRGIEELAEVMEQPPKGRAVHKDLKDSIRKTHVSSIDETARTDFDGRLTRRSGCEEGQQL
jgi:hypothetical protein